MKKNTIWSRVLSLILSVILGVLVIHVSYNYSILLLALLPVPYFLMGWQEGIFWEIGAAVVTGGVAILFVPWLFSLTAMLVMLTTNLLLQHAAKAGKDVVQSLLIASFGAMLMLVVLYVGISLAKGNNPIESLQDAFLKQQQLFFEMVEGGNFTPEERIMVRENLRLTLDRFHKTLPIVIFILLYFANSMSVWISRPMLRSMGMDPWQGKLWSDWQIDPKYDVMLVILAVLAMIIQMGFDDFGGAGLILFRIVGLAYFLNGLAGIERLVRGRVPRFVRFVLYLLAFGLFGMQIFVLFYGIYLQIALRLRDKR